MNFFVGLVSSVCISLFACSSPQKEYLEDSDNNKGLSETETLSESKAGEYTQIAEEVTAIVESIGDEIKENRSFKDSIYDAIRPEKWVIKVGDYAVDEDYLKDDYMAIHKLGSVMSFKNNSGNYFLFFEETGNEFELTEKLPNYEAKMNRSKLFLEIVDLNSFCSRKESLVITSPINIGKRKDKYEIKCYACEK